MSLSLPGPGYTRLFALQRSHLYKVGPFNPGPNLGGGGAYIQDTFVGTQFIFRTQDLIQYTKCITATLE